MRLTFLVCLLAFLAYSAATVYFKEDFDAGWESRWVHSTVDDAAGTAGKFVATPGDWYHDKAKDTGIKTSEDARYYKASAHFPKFSNKDKTLVLQYSVKNEQDLDCGGGYIKLHPPGIDQKAFDGNSKYNIMFGPDKCGSSTNRVHFIFSYKDNNHLIKKQISPPYDKLSHLFTAIVFPNQTYEVRIDNEKKESGDLVDDWDFLPPKEIKDPSKSKPENWVDEEQIPDPEAKKPDGWDEIPKEIADGEAKKPEDWDEELDGTWEAPMIPNPEYKGEWKAPMIPNPEYKGQWEHPMIPNPDFAEDHNIYAYDHEFASFEIWQVKSGTIFDHILITDSIAEAEAFATGYFKEQQTGEKEAHDKIEEEKRKQEEEERKRLEEEAKNREEEEGEEVDEEEEEDHKTKDEL